MMDGYIMLEVGEVGDLVVILFFLDVIRRGKNLVSLCCLSCLIFSVSCSYNFLRYCNPFY